MSSWWNGSKLDASPSSTGSEPTPPAGPIILLGLGFTTTRLAQRLLVRGADVSAIVRNTGRYAVLAAAGLGLTEHGPGAPRLLPVGASVVHTIPPLPAAEQDVVHEILTALQPRRVIYISSTSVYGEHLSVDATTPAAPSEPKGFLRVEEEDWLLSRPWSTLIVRAAGIYGPGRGIYKGILQNKPRRASGSGMVSRIHADDLAAVLEAGLYSNAEGAWPCADEEPCSTGVISHWCGELLQANPAQPETARNVSGRSVDGSAILRLLGVSLQYPSWRSGSLASLATGLAGEAPS